MKFLSLCVAVAFLSGCATAMTRNGVGFIFTDVKDSVVATDNSSGPKTAEACATNVLSIVSTGDMSINEAKRIGNISKVSTVDYSQFSILGLFAKTCTIVTGE